jgi:lysophospholipid acyltransferase (LPLAT)-like uncharacterized protein
MMPYLSGTALFLYSSLVHRTCRFSIQAGPSLEKIQKNGQPVILTSWHGMTMMVAGFIRRYFDIKKFNVIVPDDHRGDTLQVFARALGVKSTPLDLTGDETMGTGRKLVALIKSIKQGRNFVIHPDGPAGPAYKVKPGLPFIARKTGSWILPLGCYCRFAYHVPRWDRYTLPLPFSKVQIQVGTPLKIPESAGDLSQMRLELEKTLNQLTFQAAAAYYETN